MGFNMDCIWVDLCVVLANGVEYYLKKKANRVGWSEFYVNMNWGGLEGDLFIARASRSQGIAEEEAPSLQVGPRYCSSSTSSTSTVHLPPQAPGGPETEAEAEAEEKWLGHYSSGQSILIVGDGTSPSRWRWPPRSAPAPISSRRPSTPMVCLSAAPLPLPPAPGKVNAPLLFVAYEQ